METLSLIKATKILIISFIFFSFLNTLAFADNINTKVPLPGKTIANAKLQYDTLIPVYAVCGSLVKNCRNLSVINTEVVQAPADLVIKSGRPVSGNWKEKWTVNACGVVVQVPITFLIDATGVTYVIKQNEIYKK